MRGFVAVLGLVLTCGVRAQGFAQCAPAPFDASFARVVADAAPVSLARIGYAVPPVDGATGSATVVAPGGLVERVLELTAGSGLDVVVGPGARGLRLERAVSVRGTLAQRLVTLALAVRPWAAVAVHADRVEVLASPWVQLAVPDRDVQAYLEARVLGAGGVALHSTGAGTVRAGFFARERADGVSALRAPVPSSFVVVDLWLFHVLASERDALDGLWAALSGEASDVRFGADGAQLLLLPDGAAAPVYQVLSKVSAAVEGRRVPVASGAVSEVRLHECEGVAPSPPRERGTVLRFAAVGAGRAMEVRLAPGVDASWAGALSVPLGDGRAWLVRHEGFAGLGLARARCVGCAVEETP